MLCTHKKKRELERLRVMGKEITWLHRPAVAQLRSTSSYMSLELQEILPLQPDPPLLSCSTVLLASVELDGLFQLRI